MLAKVFAKASPAAGTGPHHRVATYNVLSPFLASPAYFRSCDPKALVPATRLAAVLEQLGSEVSKESVVALQEVSLSWTGPLHVWFAERGYTYIHSNYGNAFNGYMGVGIAYPVARYELLQAELCRLSDTKRWPKPPEDHPPSLPVRLIAGALSPMGRLLSAPVGLARRLLTGSPSPKVEDPWEFSKRRFNSFAFLRLRCRSSSAVFGVATYHMPCAFFLPPAMVIHTALAAQHASRLAGDAPYVLCGDFNIKPGDSAYALLTRGELPADDADLPSGREWDDWRPTVPTALRSAYAEIDGVEPDFTNFAQSKEDPPFIDCLDYIFYSPGAEGLMKAVAVKPLPKREDVGGPLPTLSEPSDHILIAAEFELSV